MNKMYRTRAWRLHLPNQVSHKTYKYTPTQSYSRVLTACAYTGVKILDLCVCVCVSLFAYACICMHIYITLTLTVQLCAQGLMSGWDSNSCCNEPMWLTDLLNVHRSGQKPVPNSWLWYCKRQLPTLAQLFRFT